MASQTIAYARLKADTPIDVQPGEQIVAKSQRDYLDPDGFELRSGPYVVVDGDKFVYAGDEHVLVTDWLISDVPLSGIRKVSRPVIRDMACLSPTEPLVENECDPANFWVLDMPPEDYWPLASDRADMYPDPIVELLATPSSVVARGYASVSADTPRMLVERIAASVCGREGAEVVLVDEVYRSSTEAVWCIDVALKKRGATVGQLVAMAQDCFAAIEALHGPTLDRRTVTALVRAGVPRVIEGLEEGEWFEVKSQMWNLDTLAGKIELAQDVARFANGIGGVIIVGAATRKRDGVERVTKVRGVNASMINVSQVSASLDQRIYPVVDGLSVWTSETDSDRALLVIEVPPQSDWMKPFLVSGSLVDGRVEGSFFSIVRRRGEGSVTLTAREVHAWLSAGRRLMDGQRAPDE